MSVNVTPVFGKDIKDIVNSTPDHYLYYNGYKYFFTETDLERLQDYKLYYLTQKYGLLFITTPYGKTVLVKKGVPLKPKK